MRIMKSLLWSLILAAPTVKSFFLVYLPETENGGVSPDGKVYE